IYYASLSHGIKSTETAKGYYYLSNAFEAIEKHKISNSNRNAAMSLWSEYCHSQILKNNEKRNKKASQHSLLNETKSRAVVISFELKEIYNIIKIIKIENNFKIFYIKACVFFLMKDYNKTKEELILIEKQTYDDKKLKEYVSFLNTEMQRCTGVKEYEKNKNELNADSYNLIASTNVNDNT
ncbi:hypothetical protein A3Q56_05170, partial [Intoshia linei]